MENSIMHTTASFPRIWRRRSTASKAEISPTSASEVPYEDEYEKSDSSYRLAWYKLMDEDGHYKTSSFYKKVSCLLVSWDADSDDLHTEQEVAELSSVFENIFHYKVERALLKYDQVHLAHVQVAYRIAKFIMDEDGPRTLLLVYYAGHGKPKPIRGGSHGLALTGKKSCFEDAEELNDVVWGDIENNFQHTRADVLEIFDCCYAGDLGMTRQTWGTRSFEFLGACSSGNLTRSPGKESFTTALIWALKKLVKEQTRFTLSELSCMVRQAPDFPKDQVPVQFDRDNRSIERIVLAPLDTTSDTKNSVPKSSDDRPQGLLSLNFIFEKPPSIETVKKFGKGLNRVMYNQKMPVDRIVWGGLRSWGGSEPFSKTHLTKLKVVKQFKDSLAQKKSMEMAGKSPFVSVPMLETPSSTSGEALTPSGSDSPPRKNKRVKRSAN